MMLNKDKSNVSIKSNKSLARRGSPNKTTTFLGALDDIFQDEIEASYKQQRSNARHHDIHQAISVSQKIKGKNLDMSDPRMKYILQDLENEKDKFKSSQILDGISEKNPEGLVKQNVLEATKVQQKSIEEQIAKMYAMSKSAARFNQYKDQHLDTIESDRTKPEELFDFHQEVLRLKNRALEEGEEQRFNYYANQDNGRNLRQSNKGNMVSQMLYTKPGNEQLSPQKENRLKREIKENHIPKNIDDRLKIRYERMNNEGRKNLSKSKSMLKIIQGGPVPEFKNNFKSDLNIKVGLDMLHTDELMGYYKEVVNKGKRDLIEHQRQQNYIKKLERV